MKSNDDFKAIAELDLEPIKVKLMHEESGEGWSLERANATEFEYRRFLILMKKYPHEQTAPLVDVDTFWHYHILDTLKYAADCEAVFGYFLHHFPYIGLRGEADEEAHRRVGERMKELYETTFGEDYVRGAAKLAAFSGVAAKAAFSGVAAKAAFSGVAAKAAFSGVAAKAAFSGILPQAAFSGAASQTALSGPASKTAFSGVAAKTAFSGVAAQAAFSGAAGQTAVSGVAAKTAFSGVSAKSAFSGVASQTAFSGVAAGARDSAADFYSARPRLSANA
ncbi:hypothetical protein LJR289_003518 [Pseudoduganella sp. LjRoot289]|uniref:glycine-rich domain-containing protein n=1 Tax=Pseudoduganella sp. LjRoot289 TaxID=3342314 RepID=UPI003ECE805B